MIRAFLAVEPTDDVRRQIGRAQERLRLDLAGAAAAGARIAWVRPSSIHLTLKFIGDFDEARADALRTAIASATATVRRFEMPLTTLGAFPRPEAPRAIWIGAPDAWLRDSSAQPLMALVSAIDTCCAAEGVPREARPFTPHLTLGRVKTGDRQIGRALAESSTWKRPITIEPLVVDGVVLMQSELAADRAVHTPLWTLALEDRS